MQNPSANGLSLTVILLLERRRRDEAYDMTDDLRLLLNPSSLFSTSTNSSIPSSSFSFFTYTSLLSIPSFSILKLMLFILMFMLCNIFTTNLFKYPLSLFYTFIYTDFFNMYSTYFFINKYFELWFRSSFVWSISPKAMLYSFNTIKMSLIIS
jgi:hypothetical protein